MEYRWQTVTVTLRGNDVCHLYLLQDKNTVASEIEDKSNFDRRLETFNNSLSSVVFLATHNLRRTEYKRLPFETR